MEQLFGGIHLHPTSRGIYCKTAETHQEKVSGDGWERGLEGYRRPARRTWGCKTPLLQDVLVRGVGGSLDDLHARGAAPVPAPVLAAALAAGAIAAAPVTTCTAPPGSTSITAPAAAPVCTGATATSTVSAAAAVPAAAISAGASATAS